jgi:dihydroxyacetone kinase
LDLKNQIQRLNSEHQLEMQEAYSQIESMKQVINNFKNMFNVTGEIDFG